MKNIVKDIVAIWFALSIASLGLEPDDKHLWLYIPIVANFMLSAFFVSRIKFDEKPCK